MLGQEGPAGCQRWFLRFWSQLASSCWRSIKRHVSGLIVPVGIGRWARLGRRTVAPGSSARCDRKHTEHDRTRSEARCLPRGGGGDDPLSNALMAGDLSGAVSGPATPRGSDYARLSRQVRQAGLMDLRTRHYAWRITITVVLLMGGWAAFVLVDDSWWQLTVAAYLAAIFTQLGFLGHDAGHRQISGSRRVSYVLGILLGNLGIGLSYGWWVTKHNRHHANPNTEGADPDIMMKALAMTVRQATTSSGLSQIMFRCQAYLFFPMLFGEAASLHAASIRALARPGSRPRPAEAVLLGLHIAGYLTIVFAVLSPVKAIIFILVQQGLFGFYLGASFAPNHKGMPILQPEEEHDFLRRQVLTSRNVRGGWFTDLALGGLNYQIEHHLFPSMPRPSLRRSQRLISEFCRQEGLPYCEASLVGSYGLALGYLNAVGRQATSTT
jgi:fatty acid desaturase